MYVAIEILRLVILRIIVKHASEDTKTSWMEKFAVKRYLSKYTYSELHAVLQCQKLVDQLFAAYTHQSLCDENIRGGLLLPFGHLGSSLTWMNNIKIYIFHGSSRDTQYYTTRRREKPHEWRFHFGAWFTTVQRGTRFSFAGYVHFFGSWHGGWKVCWLNLKTILHVLTFNFQI